MISPNNPFVAVLDACVLLPMPVCDTLLRLAEEPLPLYQPRWTLEILDEVRRNLPRLVPAGGSARMTEDRVDRRVNEMMEAFPDAMISGYDVFLPLMTNHPKDRHVLAAAIHGKADAIVTENLKDIPGACAAPYGIQVMQSDEFLIHQFHLNPDLVVEKLARQAAAIQHTAEALLAKLARACPRFSELVRNFPG